MAAYTRPYSRQKLYTTVASGHNMRVSPELATWVNMPVRPRWVKLTEEGSTGVSPV